MAKAGVNMIIRIPDIVGKLAVFRLKVSTVIGSHGLILLTHQSSTNQCIILNLMKITVCAPVCRSRRVIGLGLSEQKRVTECLVDTISHTTRWFAGDYFWSKKIGIFVLFILFDKILF